MPKQQKSTRGFDFEKALAELEDVVTRLEAGGLTLESSLDLFERGVALARICKERLDSAELRVTQLIREREDLIREEEFVERED